MGRRPRELHQLHCGAAQGRHLPLRSLWCSLLSSWSCTAGGREDGQVPFGCTLEMLNVFAVCGTDATMKLLAGPDLMLSVDGATQDRCIRRGIPTVNQAALHANEQIMLGT